MCVDEDLWKHDAMETNEPDKWNGGEKERNGKQEKECYI
jgi:hypothetical protein